MLLICCVTVTLLCKKKSFLCIDKFFKLFFVISNLQSFCLIHSVSTIWGQLLCNIYQFKTCVLPLILKKMYFQNLAFRNTTLVQLYLEACSIVHCV